MQAKTLSYFFATYILNYWCLSFFDLSTAIFFWHSLLFRFNVRHTLNWCRISGYLFGLAQCNAQISHFVSQIGIRLISVDSQICTAIFAILAKGFCVNVKVFLGRKKLTDGLAWWVSLSVKMYRVFHKRCFFLIHCITHPPPTFRRWFFKGLNVMRVYNRPFSLQPIAVKVGEGEVAKYTPRSVRIR